MIVVFFSCRRRHTRCELVTGFRRVLFRSLWMVVFDGGGQLGDGGNINRKTPFPLRSGICAISAGSFHSLILDETAKLWAFGYNGSGQLGSGDTPDLREPQHVARDRKSTRLNSSH